ncbi:hypothetical protein V8B97DRAFT_1918371 [Scleroderma yunnanense]
MTTTVHSDTSLSTRGDPFPPFPVPELSQKALPDILHEDDLMRLLSEIDGDSALEGAIEPSEAVHHTSADFCPTDVGIAMIRKNTTSPSLGQPGAMARCRSAERPSSIPIATSLVPVDETSRDDEQHPPASSDTVGVCLSLVAISEALRGPREHSHAAVSSTSGEVRPPSNSAPKRRLSKVRHWTDVWVTTSPPIPSQSNKHTVSKQRVSGRTPIPHWTDALVHEPPPIPLRIPAASLQQVAGQNLSPSLPEVQRSDSRAPILPAMDFGLDLGGDFGVLADQPSLLAAESILSNDSRRGQSEPGLMSTQASQAGLVRITGEPPPDPPEQQTLSYVNIQSHSSVHPVITPIHSETQPPVNDSAILPRKQSSPEPHQNPQRPSVLPFRKTRDTPHRCKSWMPNTLQNKLGAAPSIWVFELSQDPLS